MALQEKAIPPVKTAMYNFLTGNNVVPCSKLNRCEVCMKSVNRKFCESPSLLLSDHVVVGLVLRALLIPVRNDERAKTTSDIMKRPIELCEECKDSFKELSELFLQLEELASKFNKLRRLLGTKVIRSSLGRSGKEQWTVWKNEVKLSERSLANFFNPTTRNNERGLKDLTSKIKSELDSGDLLLDFEEVEDNDNQSSSWKARRRYWETDRKLKTMTPRVILTRIEEAIDCKTGITRVSKQVDQPDRRKVNSQVNDDETEDELNSSQENVKIEEILIEEDSGALGSSMMETSGVFVNQETESSLLLPSSEQDPLEGSEEMEVEVNNTSQGKGKIKPKEKRNYVRVFQCSHCGKSFTQNFSLLYHIKRYHESKESSKDEVQSNDKEDSHSSGHSEGHENDDELPISVSESGQSNTNAIGINSTTTMLHSGGGFKPQQSNLINKIAVIESGKKRSYNIYSCAHLECTITARSPLVIRRHLCQTHPEEYLRNGTLVYCQVCCYAFLNSEELNSHMEVHTDLKCRVCGAQKSNKFNLRQHMTSHTGEMPLQCSLCGKAYRYQKSLTLHMVGVHKVTA